MKTFEDARPFGAICEGDGGTMMCRVCSDDDKINFNTITATALSDVNEDENDEPWQARVKKGQRKTQSGTDVKKNLRPVRDKRNSVEAVQIDTLLRMKDHTHIMAVRPEE